LLAVAEWLWKKGRRGQIAFALLFLGPLLPVIGFFNLNGMRLAWVADRWVYFSAPVFFAVVARAAMKLPRRVFGLLAVPYVIGCGLLAARQASNYAAVETFWQAAIRGHSHPVTGHSAYGEALMREGRMEEAQKHFEEALRLEPANADLHCNMGTLFDQMGQPGQALTSYQAAIQLNPTDALFHYNLGFTLHRLGRATEAETAFREALKRWPDFLAAHNDLGNVLTALGRMEEAEHEFHEALRCRPGDTQALASLGNLRYRQRRKAEALRLFEQVLRLVPDKVPVLANAARILATSGDASLRDGAKAVMYAEKAARLSGQADAGVLNTLSAAYAEAGRFDEAVKTAQNALQLAEQAGMADGVIQSLRLTLQVVESRQPVRAAER
jgi:tetratricopeptide (TPR) repeat protein